MEHFFTECEDFCTKVTLIFCYYFHFFCLTGMLFWSYSRLLQFSYLS